MNGEVNNLLEKSQEGFRPHPLRDVEWHSVFLRRDNKVISSVSFSRFSLESPNIQGCLFHCVFLWF